MLMLALAVWASQTVQLSSWAGLFQSTGHLDKTCMSVVEALQTNKLKAPLPVCADSEPGLTLLEQENAKIYKPKDTGAGGEAVQETKQREFSVAFLSQTRQDLEKQGVAWDQVRPLAFGGVRAKIVNPQTMRDPADSVTGELFLDAGGKVIALEMTARRCGANFVITDFWNCNVLDITPDQIKDHVAQSVRMFKEEPEGDPQVQVKSPRQVFLSLQT